MMTGTLPDCFRKRISESPSSSGMLRSSTTRSGLRLLDRGAQRLAAVAERHVEAVHLQVVADHVAGGGLVVDDEDVLLLAHAASVSSSSGNAMANTAPPAEPGLSTKMRPL